MLQQWNKPRQRHVDIVPVDELGPHRRQLTSSIRSYGSGFIFDPRPTSLRESNSSQALERLRCDLLDLHQPCGLLNILVPSLLKIEHNHCYHQSRQVDNVIVSCTNNSNKNNNLPSDEAFPVHLEEETKTAEEILEDLHLTPAERLSLEEETRCQSSCWICRVIIISFSSNCFIFQKWWNI